MEYIDTWHDVDQKTRYANRVMKRDKFDVVHMHMHKDEEVKSHYAKEETLIVVRSGKVRFTVEGRAVELTNDDILQMDPYEKHDMKAIEKTDFLLLKFK